MYKVIKDLCDLKGFTRVVKDLYALINFLVNTTTEGEVASLDELQENLKISFDNFKVQRDSILISNFRVLLRDRFSDPWINIVNIPRIGCTGYRISDNTNNLSPLQKFMFTPHGFSSI